jgi:bifunctional non-homologous end joining protein LigD
VAASNITHRHLMLARSAPGPFDGPGWLYELKYDGYRVLALRRGTKTKLLSRRGDDLASRFPEIVAGLNKLPDIVLDGELVILDRSGKPQLDRLRRRARLTNEISILNAAHWEPAAILVFDILRLRGRDLRRLPLLKRREIARTMLHRAMGSFKRIRLIQQVGDTGSRLYEAAAALGLEGIVAKRADSPYRAGRSKDWIKIRTPRSG